MNVSHLVLVPASALLILATTAAAHPKSKPRPEFKTRVVLEGLHAPSGIVAGPGDRLYFTEVPTPGINGANGGMNGVKAFDRKTNTVTEISGLGEPDPVDITMGANGMLYWTCRSAGVIVAVSEGGTPMPVLTGLDTPTGISADLFGNVFWTEVPTPGVGGGSGGMNTVNVDHGDEQRILDVGDPEPTDIAVAFGGTTYWTCKSAGVIVRRDRTGATEVVLSGLDQPKSIALDRFRERLYWTEVPTPGVSGANGGTNEVWEYDLETGKTTLVDAGDPYPADITVALDGTVYWTCLSAGVIVEARRKFPRW